MAQLHARPTGDEAVVGLTSAGFATFFHGDLNHDIFSTVIFSLPLIHKGQLQFLAKECAQYWLTAYKTKPAQQKCG